MQSELNKFFLLLCLLTVFSIGEVYAMESGLGLRRQYRLLERHTKGQLSGKLHLSGQETLSTLFYEGLENATTMLSTGSNSNVILRWSRIHQLISDSFYPVHEAQSMWHDESRAKRKTLNAFSGSWFGVWRDFSVDHHWLRTIKKKRHLDLKGLQITLLAYQTAFIGDGIGWNYIVEFLGEEYLLGITYHFKNGEIMMARPHIGFSGNNSILWYTQDHIYFEYLCFCPKGTGSSHYMIDGLSLIGGKCEFFRATYTRDASHRPGFKSVKIDTSRPYYDTILNLYKNET